MEINESSAVESFSRGRDPQWLNEDPDPASALGNDAYKKTPPLLLILLLFQNY